MAKARNDANHRDGEVPNLGSPKATNIVTTIEDYSSFCLCFATTAALFT